MNHHHFEGKDIPHIKLNSKTTVKELVEIYANSGFNARQLGEAAKLYQKMIQDNATICLTVAGAMTPVGFGGIIKTLLEKGFVDWIVTTGANVYHEDHFAWGLPVKQGHFEVDDNILYEKEIVRIRDVYVKFYETLELQDNIIQNIFKDKLSQKFPEKSFLTTAYELDVPVYVSTLKDSSLALNLAVHRLKNQPFNLDFVREIIEQAAIVYNAKKSGILELGGGVPKNTAQQTGPLLDQILRKDHGGQDYIIQITDARPDTGGLSGATLQEGKSWGKVQDSHEDLITVYTDSTIAFPVLALYALANEEPKEPKRIYKNLDKYYETLQQSAIKVPEKFAEILKKADINVD